MAFKKRALFPPLIILAAIVLAIFMGSMRTPPNERAQERPAVLVEVIEVQPRDVRFQVNSQGTVEPRYQTALVSEVNGRIVSVSEHFIAGGFFEEGEELLQIDPSDYKVAVQEARANLASARADLEQELALAKVAKEDWEAYEGGETPALGIREPQVASAVARVESAEANVAKAERDLERTSIRAPFAGLLRNKDVDQGQYVGIGTQLATILGTEVAEVRVPLSDLDLAYLQLPQQNAQLTEEADVLLTTDIAGRATEWEAKLVRSEGILDANSRVIYGVVQVRDPYNQKGETHATPLRFGRFVQVALAGDEAQDMFIIPRYALNANGSVWVVGDDRQLQQKQVEVRRTDANEVYVSGGLASGDKVMLTQLSNPLAGMKVRLPGDPIPELDEGQTAATDDDESVGN